MGLRGTTTKSLSASGGFSEQIAVDCFNNTFTTYTGMPANNIPSLDDINNKGTVCICQRISYSSSSPRNSEISSISYITIATALTTYIVHTSSKEVELEGGRYDSVANGY